MAGLAGDALKLFVGHGAALRHAAHLMGILPFERIAKLSMFYAKPVVFEGSAPAGAIGTLAWTRISGDWKHRDQNDRID